MQILKQRVDSNQIHQSNSRCIKTSETDFKFLDEPRPDDSEIEFQTEHHISDQCAGSPPLWTRKASRDTTYGVSRLLPFQHHYSYPSPTRRVQAIADSRRALMERIQDMPESSFELSLKDIVDDKQSMKDIVDDKQSMKKVQTKVEIAQKNKNTKQGQILRSESMDSGVFQIKMFLPFSLGCKKKSKRKTCVEVSPKLSLEKGENCEDCISRSTGSISGNTNGLLTSNFPPGKSFNSEKSKSRRQRGCLF